MRLGRVLTGVLAPVLLAGCGADRENIADRAAAEAAPAAEAAVAPTPPPKPAPPEFQRRIEALASAFPGDVGVAVKDLRGGWAASWRGGELFPQQSSMKIWLAVAVLDAVDRGQLRLEEPVVVTPADLSLFNSPMVRPLTLRTGRAEFTIGQLLTWALSKSDNGATDILMRRMGGGAEVQKVLAAKGLREVHVGVEERLLQPRISGLEWRPEYIDGDLFNRARDRVSDAERDAALARYLQNPPDGATPIGTVNALEALATGRLLSPESTERLLTIMSEGRAGAARLKAGTPVDWRLSHKTGTGPDWRKVTAGYNDVGLMLAPDGHAYAVAVYIGRTDRPQPERQALIAAVARAVAEHWHAAQPAGAPALVMPVRPRRAAPPPPLPPVTETVVAEAAGPPTAAGAAAPQTPAGSPGKAP